MPLWDGKFDEKKKMGGCLSYGSDDKPLLRRGKSVFYNLICLGGVGCLQGKKPSLKGECSCSQIIKILLWHGSF
jgi:hypothetical protein